MLIVFSGLPGVGKTTLARALAARRKAVFLRIDTIEQAMRGAGVSEIGAAGYDVALAVAADNLLAGAEVVADCVNPVAASRLAWADVARRMNATLVDIEVICGDIEEHRRRVESRTSDIAGHVAPDWAAVRARVYEPWAAERLVVDTALLAPPAAVARIEAHLDALLERRGCRPARA